jgi:hypothetical protein
MKYENSYLYRYYADKIQEKYADSNRETTRILYESDVNAAYAYSAKIKKTVREAIPFPFERCPLNPMQTGSREFEGYSITKLVIESMPGHHIPVHLYQPLPLSASHPGLVVPIGHHLIGKALPEHQTMCANFALQGFVVICTDPMGQGERDFFPGMERNEKQTEYAAVDEHMHVAFPLLMLDAGVNITSFFLWDSVRLVDYLYTLPHVNPLRIGVTGQSGGGAQSTLLGIIEDRFSVVSPIQSCGAGLYDAKHGMGDAEQSVDRLNKDIGVDSTDKCWGIFPKKLMLNCDRQDANQYGLKFVDQEIARLYDMTGRPGNYQMCLSDGGHVIDRQVREYAYAWFNKHLNNNDGPVSEKETDVLSETELRCFPEGFTTLTSYDMCKQLLLKERERTQKDRRPISLKIKSLLAGCADKYTLDILSEDGAGGMDFVLHTLRNQYVVCRYTPGYGDVLNLVIDSQNTIDRQFDGEPVLSVHPAGMYLGDAKDTFDYDETTCAMLAAFSLGDSIFKNRLNQVITAASLGLDMTGCREVSFHGSGQGGMLGLCAAFFVRTYLVKAYRMVVSMERYFENIDYVIDESSVMPGLVGICDIFGLAAASGAVVEFIDPLDECKRVMDADTARRFFGGKAEYFLTEIL